MKTIPTRHGRLAVEITGEGSPVVLLHSGGHDRHDFDAITPSLAQRHAVVAIDLPGHGDSDPLDASRSCARAMCEGVIDAIDALDLAPAVVVGNSVGGTAALTLAIERPRRVRGLVLASTSGLVERTRVTRALCWVQGREVVRRKAGMAFARSYLKRRNEHTEALLARMRAARARPEFIAMEAALWRSFASPDSSVEDRVGEVRCPTLLVWGRHDPVIRARVEGARARALLPHAGWVEMNAGHVPFVEDPAGFLEVTRAFFAAHASASGSSSPSEAREVHRRDAQVGGDVARGDA